MGLKIYLFILGFLVVGCSGQPSHIAMLANDIPTTFEPAAQLPGPQPDRIQQKPDVVTSVKPVTDTPILEPLSEPSVFIFNAQKIMVEEGKRIGTACNRYLMRVLKLSGYSADSFLANDFDLYAKKHLRGAQIVHFANEGRGIEIDRLKKHLWSYPERTHFIMQWSRTGAVGHVAIVERIQDKLIIYQASLGKHTARKDQTTVKGLLNGYDRRKLSVYSEF